MSSKDLYGTLFGYDYRLFSPGGQSEIEKHLSVLTSDLECGYTISKRSPHFKMIKTLPARFSPTMYVLMDAILAERAGAGIDKDGCYVSQVKLLNGGSKGHDAQIASRYDPITGNIASAVVINGKTSSVGIKSDTIMGIGALLAIMAAVMDQEIAGYIPHRLVNNAYDALLASRTAQQMEATLLADHVYALINEKIIPLVEGTGQGAIKLLSANARKRGDYAPERMLFGELSEFVEAEEVSSMTAEERTLKGAGIPIYRTFEEMLRNEKVSKPRSLEEQRLIDAQAAKLSILEPTLQSVLMVKSAKTKQSPARIFQVEGPTGTGKSVACEMVATTLNLPIYRFSCQSDTDADQLIGAFVPRTDAPEEIIDDNGMITAKSILASERYPTAEQVQMLPELSYERVYGKKADRPVDKEDLLAEVMSRVMAEVDEWQKRGVDRRDVKPHSSGSQSSFVFVPSPLIRAAIDGAACEIQEFNALDRPGVMIALNELLEEGAMRLPTGQRIEMHPDAVLFFTNNPNVTGVGDVATSVLSRMMRKVTISKIPVDKMMLWVQGDNRLHETPLSHRELREMARIIIALQDLYQEKRPANGVLDFRCYKHWVAESQSLPVYLAAKSTVIDKFSQDGEDIEAAKEILKESSLYDPALEKIWDLC